MIFKFIDVERLTHSVKTVIATMIALLLTKFIGFPADQWIVITVIVVMCAQIYVGGVMQKAYLRLIGTFLGCMVAAFALEFFGYSNIVIAATLAFASFFFSYIATSSEALMYAGTLGAVTTTIIMIGQVPSIQFAITRFLEISVGIGIAAFVSQFVMPIHARTHLARAQSHTICKLKNYYIACMITRDVEREPIYYQELDEVIVKSLSKQRQLAKEAKRELFGSSYNPDNVVQTLQYEKEILRCIDFMHMALTRISSSHQFSQIEEVRVFHDNVLQGFNDLIKIVQGGAGDESTLALPSAKKLEQIKGDNLVQDKLYIDAFIFAAETLLVYLAKLRLIYKKTL